ncbi:hypothetical protein Slala05_74940 [Streptomyces lavendulae subsp. lavendulae]|nr:hypothetical protein Slala05_74940 [Streptomyces lavendulae subsp. lavendulae]
MRESVNALLFQSRTGCQWDRLPHGLAPAGRRRCPGRPRPGRACGRAPVRSSVPPTGAGSRPPPMGSPAVERPSAPRRGRVRGVEEGKQAGFGQGTGQAGVRGEDAGGPQTGEGGARVVRDQIA